MCYYVPQQAERAEDKERVAATRVLLVDDHAMFRRGLASLMEGRLDLQVVGEASDGFEAVEKARTLKPDLVLMDIRMPRCDGLRATRLLKQENPQLRIVMLTVSDEDEDLFCALKAGAQGYLLKDMSPEVLFEMLRQAAQGESPLSPAVATRILREFRHTYLKEQPAAGGPASLSAREREILGMIVEGADNTQIAERLVISEGTVKNHVHNILAKLQLKSRAQAAAYAIQEGLVDTPPHSQSER